MVPAPDRLGRMPLMSSAQTVWMGVPVRRCTTVVDSSAVERGNTDQTPRGMRRIPRVRLPPFGCRRLPPSGPRGIGSESTAAMTKQAWSFRMPYQGTRPRSSRKSNVPRAATIPAAAGPPRSIAAVGRRERNRDMEPIGQAHWECAGDERQNAPKHHADETANRRPDRPKSDSRRKQNACSGHRCDDVDA